MWQSVSSFWENTVKPATDSVIEATKITANFLLRRVADSGELYMGWFLLWFKNVYRPGSAREYYIPSFLLMFIGLTEGLVSEYVKDYDAIPVAALKTVFYQFTYTTSSLIALLNFLDGGEESVAPASWVQGLAISGGLISTSVRLLTSGVDFALVIYPINALLQKSNQLFQLNSNNLFRHLLKKAVHVRLHWLGEMTVSQQVSFIGNKYIDKAVYAWYPIVRALSATASIDVIYWLLSFPIPALRNNNALRFSVLVLGSIFGGIAENIGRYGRMQSSDSKKHFLINVPYTVEWLRSWATVAAMIGAAPPGLWAIQNNRYITESDDTTDQYEQIPYWTQATVFIAFLAATLRTHTLIKQDKHLIRNHRLFDATSSTSTNASINHIEPISTEEETTSVEYTDEERAEFTASPGARSIGSEAALLDNESSPAFGSS